MAELAISFQDGLGQIQAKCMPKDYILKHYLYQAGVLVNRYCAARLKSFLYRCSGSLSAADNFFLTRCFAKYIILNKVV
jgi:hypothetical protein